MDTSPQASPPRGLARDVDRIKTGSVATAAELRDFIGKLKGKRPQEVMGTIAGSSLVQCTTLATIITVVGMAIFTVGPYLWNKSRPAPTATAQAAPAPATAPAASTPASASPAKSDTVAAPVEPAKNDTAKGPAAAPVANPLEPSIDGKQKAIEKLGIGETKASDPKKNPLENSADDLLKDLK